MERLCMKPEHRKIFNDKIYNLYLSKAKNTGFKKISKPITEQELLRKDYITPEEILKLRTYTENVLCPASANVYGIEILRFTIKDVKSGSVLLDLNTASDGDWAMDYEEFISTSDNEEFFDSNNLVITQSKMSQINEDYSKSIIRYNFPPDILTKTPLSAMVEFKIGIHEIKNFRMIEMHFFKDKLLKTFDFTFGFCIPNSINTWEHIYDIPQLPPEMTKEIIDSPNESRSETFYFVDGKLIIHNKAEYSYSGKTDDWD